MFPVERTGLNLEARISVRVRGLRLGFGVWVRVDARVRVRIKSMSVFRSSEVQSNLLVATGYCTKLLFDGDELYIYNIYIYIYIIYIYIYI